MLRGRTRAEGITTVDRGESWVGFGSLGGTCEDGVAGPPHGWIGNTSAKISQPRSFSSSDRVYSRTVPRCVATPSQRLSAAHLTSETVAAVLPRLSSYVCHTSPPISLWPEEPGAVGRMSNRWNTLPWLGEAKSAVPSGENARLSTVRLASVSPCAFMDEDAVGGLKGLLLGRRKCAIVRPSSRPRSTILIHCPPPRDFIAVSTDDGGSSDVPPRTLDLSSSKDRLSLTASSTASWAGTSSPVRVGAGALVANLWFAATPARPAA